VEVCSIGDAVISDDAAVIVANSIANNVGVIGVANLIGIYGRSLVGVEGKTVSTGGIGVSGDASGTNVTAGKFLAAGSGSVGAKCYGEKSPLYLAPSPSASPPSHSAELGSLWVTSEGNAFMNVTGGSGYNAWRTFGSYNGDLSAYPMANGSSFIVLTDQYYFAYRCNSEWKYLIGIP
jgi:hypothetical protein